MASVYKTADPIRVGPVRSKNRPLERPREMTTARILRVVLPLTAVGLVAALFLTSRGGVSGEFQASVEAAKLMTGTQVKNPRITGITPEGSAYVLRAGVAKPDAANPTKIELEEIRGEVALPNGRTAKLAAAAGLFTRADTSVRLSGGVIVTTSDGYRIETDIVVARAEARDITSETRVVGDGPAGRICAEKMTLREADGGVALFEGDVVVILTDLPDTKEEVAPPPAEALAAAAAHDPAQLTVCQETLRALDQDPS